MSAPEIEELDQVLFDELRSEGRLEFFRRNRWQTLAGVFVSTFAMLGITWPSIDDHSAMLTFVAVHQATVLLFAVAIILPFRPDMQRLPWVTTAALTLTAVTMSCGLFVVPGAARDLEFALGIGIVLFGCVGGSGITLGPVPSMARSAMLGLTAPYALGTMLYGHWALSLGTIVFLIVVAGLGVEQMDRWFSELVALRTAESQRMRAAEVAASTDMLTGLLSRQGLQACHGQRIEQGAVGLFVDLDHFKSVNDNLGHAAGDRVLEAIAARLRTVFRPSDIVARLGGDEFFVIVQTLPDGELEALAQRTIQAAEEPILIGGQVARISASVGIGRALGPVLDLDELLQSADTALYEAKRSGRSRVEKSF